MNNTWYIGEQHNKKTKEVRYFLYKKVFFGLFKKYYRDLLEGDSDLFDGIVYFINLKSAMKTKERLERKDSWI